MQVIDLDRLRVEFFKELCRVNEVSVDDVRGASRRRRLAHIRHCMGYILRVYPKYFGHMTYPEIRDLVQPVGTINAAEQWYRMASMKPWLVVWADGYVDHVTRTRAGWNGLTLAQVNPKVFKKEVA